MRSGALLVTAVAIVIGAGCAQPRDEAGPAAPVAPGTSVRWQRIAETLAGPEDPDSANSCNRGDARCVEEVVREMRRRLSALSARCDHNAAFLFMYLQVTDGVAGRGTRIFRDQGYLNHLDAVFAELYFRAFDAFRRGDLERVPAAWRVAFDTADHRAVTGLGDMLIGMNAHISRDLPFALARIGLETAEGRSGKPDFDRVNGLLQEVQGPMLRRASERYDATIATFTVPALEFSSADTADLLGAWRSEAWRNARKLLAARTPGERAAVARRIDREAEKRARILQAATSYLLLGGSTEERDRYCATR